MDEFYEFLKQKYFIDYDDKDVKDMTEAVKCCLEELKTNFNNFEDSGLKITELFPCGSMSEHTTIWLDKHHNLIWKDQYEFGNYPDDYSCIEFDFLAVLEPLSTDMETVATCPGHAKIKSETLNDELTLDNLRTSKASTLNDEIESNSSVDSREFYNLFEKPYKTITLEFFQKLHRVTAEEKSEYAKIEKEMETGTCTLAFNKDVSPDAPVLFTWIRKTPRLYGRLVAGKIDFLPAFRTTHLPYETFILAKHCCSYESHLTCSTSPECDSDCMEQCWRISQSKEEMAFIRNTSKHHRDLYRAIKIFCDKVSRHHYFTTKLYEGSIANTLHMPSSYHMKTALIHHIKNCTDNASCVTRCLCKVLSIMKEFAEKGQILNWKGTFHLGVETYEIFIYLIMNIVFSQTETNLRMRGRDLITCLKEFNVPPVIEEKILNLMNVVSKENQKFGNQNWEDLLIDLTNCLAYPLWDYASNVINLTDNITSAGRCDILLEPVAKVYGKTVDEDSSNGKDESITKSHSESDLEVLNDFLDEKNFDKNWENIFWRLKMNSFPGSSFTQWIKGKKTSDPVYTIPEQEMLPYDNDRKECILSVIKEEEDFWFQKMLESFDIFGTVVKIP